MKVFAVIDTNVLVSALLSRHRDSATSIILANLFDEIIVPLYNDEILREYEEVLHRAKFQFPENDVMLVLSAISEYGMSSEKVECEDAFSDPKDIVFYEVALSKEDSFLVTGNTKHFPKNPIVVTPAEFLKILSSLHDGING